MTEIIQYIISNWTEWLFVGISGFLGYGYKKLLKRQKEEAQKNEALHDGMQALLRDRIIQHTTIIRTRDFARFMARRMLRECMMLIMY